MTGSSAAGSRDDAGGVVQSREGTVCAASERGCQECDGVAFGCPRIKISVARVRTLRKKLDRNSQSRYVHKLLHG